MNDPTKDRGGAPSWVPVADRLPQDGDEVIIWHVLGDGARSPHTMDFAHWMNGKWILPWQGVATWVKAWMPAPKTPDANVVIDSGIGER